MYFLKEKQRECNWILIEIMTLEESLPWDGFLEKVVQFQWLEIVVATTRRNGTRDMLTSAKLSVGYLVVGITRELNKEPSLHWFSIYSTGS